MPLRLIERIDATQNQVKGQHMKCECSGDICGTEDMNRDRGVQVCARCLLNAVNGNVVDSIGGSHKTVLCSSLRLFVCSTITVVTMQKYI